MYCLSIYSIYTALSRPTAISKKQHRRTFFPHLHTLKRCQGILCMLMNTFELYVAICCKSHVSAFAVQQITRRGRHIPFQYCRSAQIRTVMWVLGKHLIRVCLTPITNFSKTAPKASPRARIHLNEHMKAYWFFRIKGTWPGVPLTNRSIGCVKICGLSLSGSTGDHSIAHLRTGERDTTNQ